MCFKTIKNVAAIGRGLLVLDGEVPAERSAGVGVDGGELEADEPHAATPALELVLDAHHLHQLDLLPSFDVSRSCVMSLELMQAANHYSIDISTSAAMSLATSIKSIFHTLMLGCLCQG